MNSPSVFEIGLLLTSAPTGTREPLLDRQVGQKRRPVLHDEAVG